MAKKYRNREGAAEAKILELLLSKGSAYGSQVSRAANIPIGSIVNTLGSLIRNGLVERGDKKVWHLTPKGISLASLNREYAEKKAELERKYEQPQENVLFLMYGVRPEGTAATQCGETKEYS